MILGEMDEFDRMSESLREIQCGWPGRQSRGRGIPDTEMRREMRWNVHKNGEGEMMEWDGG